MGDGLSPLDLLWTEYLQTPDKQRFFAKMKSLYGLGFAATLQHDFEAAEAADHIEATLPK